MDEIRRHCALLLSEQYAEHSTAYGWLMGCAPFVATFEAMRRHDVTIFDLARLLQPAAPLEEPLAAMALEILKKALVAHPCDFC